MTPQQKSFDEVLAAAKFIRGSTYRQIGEVPQLAPEKYWKKFNILNITYNDKRSF